MKPRNSLSKFYTPAKCLAFAFAFAALAFVGAAQADGGRDSGSSGGSGGVSDVPEIRDSGSTGGAGGVDEIYVMRDSGSSGGSGGVSGEIVEFKDLGKCERDRHPDHPGSCFQK